MFLCKLYGWSCGKIPVERNIQSSTSGTNNLSELKITFLPHSDLCFELQQVILTTSKCIRLLPCNWLITLYSTKCHVSIYYIRLLLWPFLVFLSVISTTLMPNQQNQYPWSVCVFSANHMLNYCCKSGRLHQLHISITNVNMLLAVVAPPGTLQCSYFFLFIFHTNIIK